MNGTSDQSKGFPAAVAQGMSHIAIAVPHLEMADKWLSLVPVLDEWYYESAEQGVRVRVFETPFLRLEFLAPLHEKSTVSSFLATNPKGGIHHVCFETGSASESSQQLKQAGIRSISRKRSTGIMGKEICFFNPKDLTGVLVELESIED